MNVMTETEGKYASPFKARYDNFIGGEWVAPVNGRYFDNITPITGAVVCEVARSDAADVELALDAAHAAKEGAAASRAEVEEELARAAERVRDPRQRAPRAPRTAIRVPLSILTLADTDSGCTYYGSFRRRRRSGRRCGRLQRSCSVPRRRSRRLAATQTLTLTPEP